MELSCAGTALEAIPRRKCDALVREKSLCGMTVTNPCHFVCSGVGAGLVHLPREPEFCSKTCIS